MVHSEEELKMLVTASQEAGVLEEQEEQMLHRVFGFADLTAGQVMVPRTELVAIAASATSKMLLDLVTRPATPRCRCIATTSTTLSGSCTSPTCCGRWRPERPDIDTGALAREALTVPETNGADDLLAASAGAACARRS